MRENMPGTHGKWVDRGPGGGTPRGSTRNDSWGSMEDEWGGKEDTLLLGKKVKVMFAGDRKKKEVTKP